MAMQMQMQCDAIGSIKEDLKSQFLTREGAYRQMSCAEYSRPNRAPYSPQTNTPCKVSFVALNDPTGNGDRICFNVGRELYVYQYHGTKKAADLTKPIDKRVYKGTHPTCHDFNQSYVSSDSALLLVGFSAGQIQLIDPIRKDISKLYNEERLIDRTKVTCIKWVPGSRNLFLVSHGSGQLYLYKEDLPCGTAPPNYQLFKQGEGFSVYTCKTKSTRNPLYRWVIGEGSLNEFAFSSCYKYLATVSQDGFLRVFNYDTMELYGKMRSYFGGLLCVCWSPDSKYIVTGGEDDLVTVWSFTEKRVVARGQGHKSWVNVVAFDSFTTSYDHSVDFYGSDDELADSVTQCCSFSKEQPAPPPPPPPPSGLVASNASPVPVLGSTASGSCRTASTSRAGSISNCNSKPAASSQQTAVTSYRFGSVGQDTYLCFWDLTDDILKQPVGRSRTSILLHSPSQQLSSLVTSACNSNNSKFNHVQTNCVLTSSSKDSATSHYHHNNLSDGGSLIGNQHQSTPNSLQQNCNSKSAIEASTTTTTTSSSTSTKKEHKRNFSLGARNCDKNSSSKGTNKDASHKTQEDPTKLLGTPICPRLDEVPILEPLICKKVSHERLTSLVFREDGFVIACQEGYVATWARPGKWATSQLLSSPSPSLTENNNDLNDEDGGSVV